MCECGQFLPGKGDYPPEGDGRAAGFGVSRARLVRQLVIEGVPIALLGGATGLLLSIWGCALLWRALREMMRNAGVNLFFR